MSKVDRGMACKAAYLMMILGQMLPNEDRQMLMMVVQSYAHNVEVGEQLVKNWLTEMGGLEHIVMLADERQGELSEPDPTLADEDDFA